jgi:photosystem II stability/assembly factor-like uncharacterized protein
MKKILMSLSVIIIALTGQTCNLMGNSAAGVYRSIDGGKSWQSINELKVKGERSDNPPAIVYSVAIDPKNSDIIYVGTSGRGLYKTENNGRTWKKINSGITLSGTNPVIYDIIVDPKDGNNIYCAGKTQDYGKIFKSTDAGANWREILSESEKDMAIISLAISWTNPNIIIAGSQIGNVYASSDKGETWQHAGSLKNKIISVGIDNKRNSRIYAATQALGAYRSDNFGKNWIGLTGRIGIGKLANGQNNTLMIGRMAISPSSGSVLYLGTKDGIYRSMNAGNSWKLLSTLLPRNDALLTSDIKVSFQNPEIIYFSVPNVIYKAENKGDKWVSAQVSLNAKVNKLAVDPKNPDIIWAGVGK